MLCNLCKASEATVHLTQIIGNETQKIDLCESCSKEKGLNEAEGFSLAELLGLQQADPEVPAPSQDLQCPRCGYTHAEFKKAGRMGCPDCYATFAGGMESLLKSMHKDIRHVGKTPARHRESRALNERLAKLQQELTEAVEQEKFEQAAVLRDGIKEAQAELQAFHSSRS